MVQEIHDLILSTESGLSGEDIMVDVAEGTLDAQLLAEILYSLAPP